MKIEIYSKENCYSCKSAIQLVEIKGHVPIIKTLGVDFTREELLKEFSDAKQFPQIKIDGNIVGGFKQLRDFLN